MTKPQYLFTGAEWNVELIKQTFAELDKIAPELKLDIYPNQIEVVTSEQMLDAYSSVGLPVMYKHWSFGKRLCKDTDAYQKGKMGLAMEMVLNTNPCINFLMEENSATTQVLVLAHAAYGHNHVFKNNYMFKDWTDASSIVDYLVFAKNFIADCEEKYGHNKVEKTLDAAHALMNYGVDRLKRPVKLSVQKEQEKQEERKKYLQDQINELWRTVPINKKVVVKNNKFLKEPEENILYFLEKKSPKLEPWQREILRIVRKIAQYFEPQRQCLTGNHVVSTPDGLVKLRDLIKTDGYYSTSDVKLLTEGNTITDVSHLYKAKANTYRVTTEQGRVFTATAEHPLQTLNKNTGNVEMLSIGDMAVGDALIYKLDYDIFNKNLTPVIPVEYNKDKVVCEICKLSAHNIGSHVVQTHEITVQEYRNIYQKDVITDHYRLHRSTHKIVKYPAYFTPQLSRIFGYLLNSFVSHKNTAQGIITFTSDAEEVMLDFIVCLSDEFGIEVKYKKELTIYRCSFSSFMLKKFYYQYVNEVRNRHEIPKFVFSLNKECIANFVRSYFDSTNSNFQYLDNRVRLSGYSSDSADLQDWMTILIGFGIVLSNNIKERGSYESLCHTLGIEGCYDNKAYDHTLAVKSEFIDCFMNNIGSSRTNVFKRGPKSNNTHYVPGMVENFNNARVAVDEEIEILLQMRSGAYAKIKREGNLLSDWGLVMKNKFPRKRDGEITYLEVMRCIHNGVLENLKKAYIKTGRTEFGQLIVSIESIKNSYTDVIVDISDNGVEDVYDVTVPHNHLFWCDGLISHNTKTLNEGWASFTHYYMMNRLWDKGLLTDGAMLEFFQLHSSVLYQPGFDSKYYSGMNPYYLGFEIFSEIRRMCEHPTDEDRKYFPDLVDTPWVDACIDAVANYRDESFIRQFLTPNLCRKMGLFLLNDDSRSDYNVAAIHDETGYKKIKKALADQYLTENYIPKIEIVDVDHASTRKLTLMYHQNDNKSLSSHAGKVMKYIEELWGFPVELVDQNSNTYNT